MSQKLIDSPPGDVGASVRVDRKHFCCTGAKPPFDHPRVALNMGENKTIICPYCSTLYVYDEGSPQPVESFK